MAVPNPLQPLLQQLGSIRGAVFVIGKICLVLSVGLAHAIGDKLRLSELRELPSDQVNIDGDVAKNQREKSIASYQIITSRNIFGEEPKAEESPTPQPEKRTDLKLRLVGTNIRSKGEPFAIIEDAAKKGQDVFALNESVFDQAKLIEIGIDTVKLERDGRIEILEMVESQGGGDAPAGGISSNEEGTEFTVAESELTDALANLPRLLSQARAVPYFRNGQSIGMRLFAIRRGSLYEKLGLKNGDIILSVNKNSVNDPAQALKIFEQLKSERSINLELERNGQNSTLEYSIR